MTLDINLFDYHLPEGKVALYPAEPRHSSKLLFLPRHQGRIRHLLFTDLPSLLKDGDLLVLNDSKVFPARLHGKKRSTGGNVELFLLQKIDNGVWEALVRPGRRLPPGTEVELFGNKLRAKLGGRTSGGGRQVSFSSDDGELMSMIWQFGEVPLPPYIDRQPEEADKSRYQTIYAQNVGAVAAPTAGFHFTDSILEMMKSVGAQTVMLTLHPGLGTFRPITRSDIAQHQMHSERFCIAPDVAHTINRARREKRRIIAVGTTTVRALESSCDGSGLIESGGWRETELFIKQPYEFKCLDGLLTNFHLPKSTLLILVSALAGRERVLAAYQEAIERDYRFYTYGDAMLIL